MAKASVPMSAEQQEAELRRQLVRVEMLCGWYVKEKEELLKKIEALKVKQ